MKAVLWTHHTMEDFSFIKFYETDFIYYSIILLFTVVHNMLNLSALLWKHC